MNIFNPPTNEEDLPAYQLAVAKAQHEQGRIRQVQFTLGWKDLPKDYLGWNLICAYRIKPVTVSEWLHTLPDGIRERALKNCVEPDEGNPEDLSEALRMAFYWPGTPEHLDFWQHVREAAEGKAPWPKDPTAQGHNPDKLTDHQVGEGFRILSHEEINSKRGRTATDDLEFWDRGEKKWKRAFVFGYMDTLRTQKPAGFFLEKTQEQKDQKAYREWKFYCSIPTTEAAWLAACKYARQ